MLKQRIFAILIIIVGVFLGLFIAGHFKGKVCAFNNRHPFRLGLDLSGGTHLLYKADTSAIGAGDIDSSMSVLRDVIERRVNLFGVSEPTVQTETASLGNGQTENRLSVELPGVTDVSQAEAVIGQTPFLEFKVQSNAPQKATVGKDGKVVIDENQNFVSTGLTGKYLKKATLDFNQSTGDPLVSLQFNDEGSKLFQQITHDNVGKVVAIYLDGSVISAPVVKEEITGGQAQISGDFTAQQSKDLVNRLNAGALPVPISLISTETIGATLGGQAVHAGMMAALIGFILVAFFLIVWYRLPGLIAVIALSLYVIITLMLYRFIPVTMSAAGIAGFIISIGMAVDANILVFERFREERKKGHEIHEALEAGFTRAWTSIRDANTSSFIIAVILFWFGTPLIKGFALTFGLGVLVSLLSAITITRLFLRALLFSQKTKFSRFLFSSGFVK